MLRSLIISMNIPLQTRVLPQTSALVPRTTMKNFIAQAKIFWVYVQSPLLRADAINLLFPESIRPTGSIWDCPESFGAVN